VRHYTNIFKNFYFHKIKDGFFRDADFQVGVKHHAAKKWA